jgi:hypothetical protein
MTYLNGNIFLLYLEKEHIPDQGKTTASGAWDSKREMLKIKSRLH